MEWQKQTFNGTGMISGALAGKIQRGRTETTAFRESPAVAVNEKTAGEPAAPNIWQSHDQQPEVTMEQYDANGEIQNDDLWHKVMMIGVLVAVIFLVLSVVLILYEQITAAIVFVMIALGAAALAVVGLIQAKRQQ